MTVSRACVLCSAAKTKCDLVRPSCGRCTRRGLTCSGFPADSGFIFRDENKAAQRNSERARRERRKGNSAGANPSVVIVLSPDGQVQFREQKSKNQILQKIVDMSSPQLSPPQLKQWIDRRSLTNIPRPLKRDLENDVLDRFFLNWTLYPSSSGVSPGHMHELPNLYLKAAPKSVLWYAVRAMAFADMRHTQVSSGLPFYIRSRQGYGAALHRIREIAHDKNKLADDQVLAAIILIDNFESMYLARNDLLESHIGAVKRILSTQDSETHIDTSSVPLWRVARQRLQVRQILLREEPDDDQIAWVGKLNLNVPDLHISADIMHMSVLNAAAKKLIEGRQKFTATLADQIQYSGKLITTIQDLIASIDGWTSSIAGVWRAEEADPHDIAQPSKTIDPSGFPIPNFPCPHMLSYHDIWLAYMWNLHAASQIILRESLIDVLSYRSITLQEQIPDIEDMHRIHCEQLAIDQLSARIIQSIPWLLGFAKRAKEPYTLPQGKMVGRLFSLFSICVVQRARFTSVGHKKTASDVMQWIKSSHGLE